MEIEPEEGYKEYCRNWTSEEETGDNGSNVIGDGSIEFDGLHARYRKDLPDVLKGVSCRIQPGEKVGIVGRTGAGKTTLINTLLGITEVSRGRILLGGASLGDLPL